MKTAARWMFVFVVAASVGYGASDASARIKMRCVDAACMAECQQYGGGNCVSLCHTDCEE